VHCARCVVTRALLLHACCSFPAGSGNPRCSGPARNLRSHKQAFAKREHKIRVSPGLTRILHSSQAIFLTENVTR